MLDFNICRKCEHCTYHPPEYNEQGEIDICPSVRCALDETRMLFMNSEPPKGCPFRLEHMIFMQDAPVEIIEGLSGGKPKEMPDEKPEHSRN